MLRKRQGAADVQACGSLPQPRSNAHRTHAGAISRLGPVLGLPAVACIRCGRKEEGENRLDISFMNAAFAEDRLPRRRPCHEGDACGNHIASATTRPRSCHSSRSAAGARGLPCMRPISGLLLFVHCASFNAHCTLWCLSLARCGVCRSALRSYVPLGESSFSFFSLSYSGVILHVDASYQEEGLRANSACVLFF